MGHIGTATPDQVKAYLPASLASARFNRYIAVTQVCSTCVLTGIIDNNWIGDGYNFSAGAGN
jgi:hypothetical protein